MRTLVLVRVGVVAAVTPLHPVPFPPARSEDELLEWLSRHNTCPMDNKVLNPDLVKKPSCVA